MKRFNISNSTRCSIFYRTSKDYKILGGKELFEAIYALIGKKSKEFEVSNFYGSITKTVFTITGIEERFNCIGEKIGYSIIMDSYDNTPECYYPTPFQIAKQFGLISPISYSV